VLAGTTGDGQKGGLSVYLYNRLLTVRPDAMQAGSAALVDAVTHLNGGSTNQFALWQGLLGGPVGTFAASCRMESYGAFTDEVARVYAEDQSYVDKAQAVGAHMVGSAVDSLWNVVHTAGDVSETPNVVSNFAWQVNPHEIAANMEWAIETATFMNGQSGTPATVGFSQYGLPNTFRFIFGYDTVADLEERTAATQAHPGFAERMAATGALGVARDMQSGIARRIL